MPVFVDVIVFVCVEVLVVVGVSLGGFTPDARGVLEVVPDLVEVNDTTEVFVTELLSVLIQLGTDVSVAKGVIVEDAEGFDEGVVQELTDGKGLIVDDSEALEVIVAIDAVADGLPELDRLWKEVFDTDAEELPDLDSYGLPELDTELPVVFVGLGVILSSVDPLAVKDPLEDLVPVDDLLEENVSLEEPLPLTLEEVVGLAEPLLEVEELPVDVKEGLELTVPLSLAVAMEVSEPTGETVCVHVPLLEELPDLVLVADSVGRLLEETEIDVLAVPEGDLDADGEPLPDLDPLPDPVTEEVRSGDRVPEGLPEADRVPVEVRVEDELPVEVLVQTDVHVLDALPEELFDTDTEPDAERDPTPDRVGKGDAEEERVPNELLEPSAELVPERLIDADFVEVIEDVPVRVEVGDLVDVIVPGADLLGKGLLVEVSLAKAVFVPVDVRVDVLVSIADRVPVALFEEVGEGAPVRVVEGDFVLVRDDVADVEGAAPIPAKYLVK